MNAEGENFFANRATTNRCFTDSFTWIRTRYVLKSTVCRSQQKERRINAWVISCVRAAF